MVLHHVGPRLRASAAIASSLLVAWVALGRDPFRSSPVPLELMRFVTNESESLEDRAARWQEYLDQGGKLAEDDPEFVAASWLGGVFPTCYGESCFDFEGEINRTSQLLHLAPGQTYCEIGAGKGKFAIRLAQHVMPAGKLILTVGTREEQKLLTANLAAAGLLSASTVVVGDDARSGLPHGGECDALMSRMSYHEFYQPKVYAREMFEALRPGGYALITDHAPKGCPGLGGPIVPCGSATGTGKPWPRGGLGTTVPVAVEVNELVGAGFALDAVEDWSMFFTRGYAIVVVPPVSL